jgi:hypothetical protein
MAPTEPEEMGPPSSILGSRLAVTADTSVPSLEEMGLKAAKNAAFEWQQQRSYALWHELRALLSRYSAADWVPEIHGLLGVVGEQVLVAVEAEAEKELLVRHLAALPASSHSARAAASRALRFFAEGQGNALVVAGHGVANLVVRTVALDPDFEFPWRTKSRLSDFVPRSEAGSSWLSLDAKTVLKLRSAAVPCVQQMRTLVQQVADLQEDPHYAALVKLRNIHYHRWRGESPGVTGINWRADTLRQRAERGESVGLSRELLPDYTEGRQSLTEVVTTTRAALDAFSARMPPILAVWVEAFQAALA